MDNEIQNLITKTFDAASQGYDRPALKFFQNSAKQIPKSLMLSGNEKVLDIATGTGNAAISIAKYYPDCNVTGIDLSGGMMGKAKEKADKEKLKNIQFMEMDMQKLEFPDDFFDAAVSSFSIFFVPDMVKELKIISSKVKRHGKILTTTFTKNSFLPLKTLMSDRLKKYGIEMPENTEDYVGEKSGCISLFQKAGLSNIVCTNFDFSYYLTSADQWWDIVWHAGFRGVVSQLPEDKLKKFREEHIKEVSEIADENGIYLEVGVLFTVGSVFG